MNDRRDVRFRVAMLHMAAAPGAVHLNRATIERGLDRAAQLGARWVLTPELAVSGYTFHEHEGTDWIGTQPDPWVRSLVPRLAATNMTLFLGLPERAAQTGALHNTLLVVGPDGVVGRHRKVATTFSRSEAWACPGDEMVVVHIDPVGPVGLMVCADAHDPANAESLAAKSARLLVSGANWAATEHGPSGEWERASEVTSLPVFVCNRTGPGRALDFRRAPSVIVDRGVRIWEHASPHSAVLTFDWSLNQGLLGAPTEHPL